jgi:hypothetical protein
MSKAHKVSKVIVFADSERTVIDISDDEQREDMSLKILSYIYSTKDQYIEQKQPVSNIGISEEFIKKMPRGLARDYLANWYYNAVADKDKSNEWKAYFEKIREIIEAKNGQAAWVLLQSEEKIRIDGGRIIDTVEPMNLDGKINSYILSKIYIYN